MEARWRGTAVDAVAISHEFTDHCHKETLLELHSSVPVFAIKEAATLIRGWKHFKTVTNLSLFGKDGNVDWRSTSIPPLPDWIGISRLLQTDDVLNYHAALLITWNKRHSNVTKLFQTASALPNGKQDHHTPIVPNEDDEAAEAIIYSPHGIHSSDLEMIPIASPSISTLAFLHGLHDVKVNAIGRTALQSNLGAHNGLKAQRILNASYWISTHDEIKTGGGIVSYFLNRNQWTLKDALEAERREKEENPAEMEEGLRKALDDFDDPHWLELKNGESRVLL